MIQSGHCELHLPTSGPLALPAAMLLKLRGAMRLWNAVDARLASLGPGAFLLFRWDKQTNSNSVHGDLRRGAKWKTAFSL